MLSTAAIVSRETLFYDTYFTTPVKSAGLEFEVA